RRHSRPERGTRRTDPPATAPGHEGRWPGRAFPNRGGRRRTGRESEYRRFAGRPTDARAPPPELLQRWERDRWLGRRGRSRSCCPLLSAASGVSSAPSDLPFWAVRAKWVIWRKALLLDWFLPCLTPHGP